MKTRIHFSESRFARRWSPAVSKAGFTPIPTSLLRKLNEYDLTHQEFLVLMHLLSYWYYNDNPSEVFPSANTIAEALSMGRSTVGKHLKSLEDKNFIEREARIGSSNIYHLQGTVNAVFNYVTRIHPPHIRGGASSELNNPPSSKTSSIKEELLRRGFKNENINREIDPQDGAYGV
jgi:DNA-binding transcriptional ArsR family regulator